MSGYSELEQHIIELFNNCGEVTWCNQVYSEIKAFKPTTSGGGECKTDVYVSLMKNGAEDCSLTISVKKENWEFVANKLTTAEAKNILGEDWKGILNNSIQPIENAFLKTTIFYPKTIKERADIYFTLGWKLEITNKARALSAPLILDNKNIVNKVFKGTEQPANRKHALVNGEAIKNSGVANYLLESSLDKLTTVESVLSSMVDLSTYNPPTLYLVFTGNNYRIVANKADGPRTLAVYIKWEIQGDKIKPNFVFDEPLSRKGETDMMPIIKNSLEIIGIPKESFGNKTVDIEKLFEEINKSLILIQ